MIKMKKHSSNSEGIIKSSKNFWGKLNTKWDISNFLTFQNDLTDN